MPSSLIIVALAVAWLVVLVPMIARKRQEVARTNDSALAARVVRSGGARRERWEEYAMSDNAMTGEDLPADADEVFEDEIDDAVEDEYVDEPEPQPRQGPEEVPGPDQRRKYRPGRGGFDPEAAEIAARAKYATRQRIVVGLLIAAVLTVVLAAALWTTLWWLHGAVDVALVGYLAYLRRQVRIENDIRERRLARLDRPDRRAPAEAVGRRAPVADQDEDPEPEPMPEGPSGRQTPPPPRFQHDGVVVDLDDEDPAFHELDQPGEPPYRRAAGE